MIYKSGLLLLFGIILSLRPAYAQFANNAHQVSSNNAGLLSQVDQPVSLNTGSVDVSIPLFAIGTKNIQLPVSLNYQTKGIKITDEASNVGLNFNLNAGGKITRVVRGLPDDVGLNPYWISSQQGVRDGRLWNHRAPLLPGFVETGTTNDLLAAIRQMKDSFRLGISPYYTSYTANQITGTGNNDLEPDIFYFSFGQYSGKFVFNVDSNNNLSVSMIPYQNIKIEPNFNGNGEIASFEIRDATGSKYLFDMVEYIHDKAYFFDEVNNPSNDVTLRSSDYSQAWNLSKVTDIDGEEINLTYSDEYYTDLTPVNFVYRGDSNYTSTVYSCSIIDCNTGKRITSIETKNARVDFIADSVRQDMMGNSKAITKIKLWQKNAYVSGNNFATVLRKEYRLSYGYFQSPAETWEPAYDLLGHSPAPAYQPLFYKRLRLDKVQEFGSNNIALPPYQFSYNTAYPLPYRFSHKRDFWGYYNGSDSNTSLQSNVYIYPGLSGSERLRIFPKSNYAGSDADTIAFYGSRMPGSDSVMSAGMLTEIKYPAGGSVRYEYESDTYFYDGENYRGGGLRIKNIRYYDGISTDPVKLKSYTYNLAGSSNSSGKAVSIPVFAYPADGGTLRMSDRCSNPGLAAGYIDSKTVGYTEVTEHFGNSGSHSVYKYTMPATHGDINDSSGDGLYQASRTYGVQQTTMHSLAGWQTFPGWSLASKEIQLTYNTYPFAPNTAYEWNRGYLLSQEDYDNSGNLVHKLQNTYHIWYKNADNTPTRILGLVDAIVHETNQYIYEETPSGFSDWIFFSKYLLVGDCAKVLSSTTDTTYDQLDLSRYSATKTSYAYGHNHTNPLSVTSLVNNGENSIRTYLYANDLNYQSVTPSSPSEVRAYKTMSDKNLLQTPVQTSIYIEKNSVRYMKGSSLYTYDLMNNIPRLKKYFSMNLPAVANDTPGFFIDNSSNLAIDSRYISDESCDQYDSSGSLLQLTKNMNTGSFIYDYDNSLVTAKIGNAKSNEVAYCSFENASYSSSSDKNFGNWNIAYPSNMVSPGFTGSRAYMLNGGGGGTEATKINLDYVSGKKYIVSFWQKDNTGNVLFNDGSQTLTYSQVGPTVNGWTYREAVFTAAAANIGFWIGSGNPIIDELRLYPANAQMETYTYTPTLGITAKSDARNNILFYEYDDLGRPYLVKDINGNIIKKTEHAVQQAE